MAVSDAVTARAMATYHKRSVQAIVRGMGDINALLRLMLKRKPQQIRWGGHGDSFEWVVAKLEQTAEWTTGELGSRTFEEVDPAQKASLDYCFLEKTYGVGEATIKTNRARGFAKLVDLQAEAAREAQMAMYRSIVDAIYSDSDGSKNNGPAGLRKIVGDAYNTTGNVTVGADEAYAGITMNTSAISSYSAKKAGWDQKWWAPEAIAIDEIPGTANNTWSADCLDALAWAPVALSRTSDVAGTSKIIRPDLALMASDPYVALWQKLVDIKGTGGTISLTREDFQNVGIHNVIFGPLTCVLDSEVPDDSGSEERVFVLDSKAFVIETCNTKAEGLIEQQFDADDPKTVGAVGVYKSNMGLRCETPSTVGVVVGCND